MKRKLIERVLAMDNLAAAWERVAENQGAPGVDGVSIRRFARNWEENLRRMRDRVGTNCYKPARLRRTAVPKAHGAGQRLISVPIVADRVLQRAVLNVVDDLFDREFLECSYGYRRGRGLRQAVAALLRYRDQGLTWVLDADIDECFDSLDHSLLEEFLADKVDDPVLMGLMRAWLQVGRRFKNPDRGIALGMPVSPLWCNVYLHRLDWELVRNRWAVARYADDFVTCGDSRKQAEQAQRVVTDVLADLRLQLEPTKTRITNFDEGFEFLGVRFYRDTYSFLWEGKTVEVAGPVPSWIWSYMPEGYE
jgi:group II intron reverse transcriptase/maturase